MNEANFLTAELASLFWIMLAAAIIPLIVGLLRLKIAEVVLLIAAGVILGPEVLNAVTLDAAIDLISEIGLGFLFFLAGYELDTRVLKGQTGKLAAIGWGVSLLLAGITAGLLELFGITQDFLGIAIALTSTALGTLLPVIRDAGLLGSPYGKMFMAAGAWGEFGPILAIAVLLGTKSKFVAIVTLVVFGVIAALLALLPRVLATERIRHLLNAGYSTTAQTGIRLTVLILIMLLALADSFGLDVVLGAFIAGLIVRRYAPEDAAIPFEPKVEGIAFGIFIPIFFVVTGARLDVVAITENPLLMLLFFALLFLVRGVPQYLIYRTAIPDKRERASLSLHIATALPIVVAVTTIEVKADVMSTETAAALVGAAALSVFVFPLLSYLLYKPDPARATETV